MNDSTSSKNLETEHAELKRKVHELKAALRQAVQVRTGQNGPPDRPRGIKDLDQALSKPETEVDRLELDAIRDELLSRLEESEKGRSQLKDALASAQVAWEKERTSLEARLEKAESRARDVREELRAELAESVTAEYRSKLAELGAQKEALDRELSKARTAPLAAAQSSESSESKVSAELAKVDARIAEMTAIIEDPNSALSKVVQKNVERSEWEAYRRGICYRDQLEPTE